MSDVPVNPYESPQAEVSAVKPLAAQGVLTETMLFHLKKAAPWLRFIGIAGFIILGLMAVGVIAMAIGFQGLFNSALGSELADTGMESFGGIFSVMMVVYLIGIEVIYFFPVFFIFQFGGKIKAYLHSGNDADLEQAFKHNRSLWTFTGVLSIIGLAFVGIFVVIGVIGVVVATMII